VHARFTALVELETDRLIDAIEPAGRAELRRSLAGPLAVAVVADALGLAKADAGRVLGWYDAIVRTVTRVTAGDPIDDEGREAFESLRATIEPTLEGDPDSSLLAAAAGEAAGLTHTEVVSNAAVLMFGGIETTEGMIANALLHLLAYPAALALVEADRSLLRNAVEESLRLEPAAAVIDRYATEDARLGGASIGAGELVRISITGANRDPRFFADPDHFDVRRDAARHHIAFAHGPHVCIGMHLARLEAHTAIGHLLDRLPRLRLDPDLPSRVRGFVFRKPSSLHVLWGGT